MKTKFFICLILAQFLSLLTSQEIQINTSIDWEKMVLQLDMTAPITEESNQPTGRYKTEQYILRETPVTTGEVLLPLIVDSWNSMQDLVIQTPVLLRQLENLSETMIKQFTTATPDRKFLTVRYELALFPSIASLLIKHDKPFSYPVDPAYIPTDDFTGIVIFAAEDLPDQGSSDKGTQLTPCLFPRLYDPELNEIHSMELTDPEAVRKWGNAGYTYSTDMNNISSRIGVYPLRTVARGIYGKNRTDIILSKEAVTMITTSPHNRELLQQGKVVIILPIEMKE